MSLLSNILAPTLSSPETLLVIQYTLATPWIPIFHASHAVPNATIVYVNLLHPLATAALQIGRNNEHVKVIDLTSYVPGYESDGFIEDQSKSLAKIREAIDNAPIGPVVLLIDSPDTLCEDSGSPSKAYTMLKIWHSALSSRPMPSRLVLPLSSRSPLLSLLLTPAFAPSLAYITLHPPLLLRHLSTAYLTLPPPHSSPAKFWPLFSGITARGEAERLVWDSDSAGWGHEVVVEVLVRSANGKRTVERTLEGWRKAGPCSLEDLEELKGIWTKGTADNQQEQKATADPTHNVSFNLNLTEAQQRSRAQVPLPYVHEGQRTATIANTAGAIFYDPDSADDIDDDDPDEDLDI